jgi:carbon storage regulator CsrA
MLVLSRKLNQKVLFPGVRASVQIVSVKGNVVRLGIEAPPGLTILREEIAGLPAPARPPQAYPNPPGRSAPEPPVELSAVSEVDAAAAALAAVTDRQRQALPPDGAALLARIEDDLRALRRRLATQTPAAQRHGGAGQRRTALVVEDNANERELLATFLRMAGLSVDTAGDGADALGYLATHPRPDVVLMDMGLPRCDGPTAIRAIRHNPQLTGVKIVAVTGHAADEFDLTAGPAGVDRWFRKPVDPALLVRELERELATGQCPR